MMTKKVTVEEAVAVDAALSADEQTPIEDKRNQRPKVDAFWRVVGDVEIRTPSGRLTVYLRTLSGSQNEYRRQEALSAARAMRTRLADKDSDEYRRNLSHLEVAATDTLLDIAEQFRRAQLWSEATWEVFPIHDPRPPKRATLMEVLEVEDQQDTIEKDVQVARSEWVDKEAVTYLEETRELELDVLRESVVDMQITAAVNGAFQSAYDAATLFYGSYAGEDMAAPFIPSLQGVADVNPHILRQIRQAYNELDSFSWGSDEELKA